MHGSPGMLSAPELPAERRLALIVATASYVDSSLRQLRAPAQDASELSQVLADPRIGRFDVVQVIDRSAQEIRLAIEEFVSDRRPDDLLLIYLSCHGLIDPRRRLYFAATDTLKHRLAATGVESEWLLDQMDDCRARRQVIILDCCFSGAFARGAKGVTDVDLGERFHGHGRGRVVLTASRGTEYSFEGEPVDSSVSLPGSVFTSALVAGIRTGEADRDNDGFVSVDEAYTYAFDVIRTADANQTPQRWLYGAEGQIFLARNVAGRKITPGGVPEDIRAALESPHPAIRLGAVSILGEWFRTNDSARAAIARDVLQRVADQEIPQVAAAAREIIHPRPAVERAAWSQQEESSKARVSSIRQLDPTEQDYLVKQIGLTMRREAPAVWNQLTVKYRAIGNYSEAVGTVKVGYDAPAQWSIPEDIVSMFTRLREGMYREDRGTWTNAKYTLDFPSTYNLDYDRDEPQWLEPPPAQAYTDELEIFPRPAEKVPEWLSRYHVKLTQLSHDVEVHVPQFSALGAKGQRWPIQPLAGDPPLTLFRGKRMTELRAGTELDRFGSGDGNLTYAAGTPFSHRSLVPEWVNLPFHTYRVARPMQVLTGLAIPWFEQAGGGTAYLLPEAIDTLLADGRLVEISGRQRPLG
jgi:uncharacterized caspase-like protein